MFDTSTASNRISSSVVSFGPSADFFGTAFLTADLRTRFTGAFFSVVELNRLVVARFDLIISSPTDLGISVRLYHPLIESLDEFHRTFS